MDTNIEKIQQNLILSVGIHRKKRILTPIEVAEGIKVLRDHKMSTKDIRELLMLESDSMILKFERLLELSPEIQHLIDWGQSSSAIAFTSASEIAKMKDFQEQKLIADNIIKEKLTKTEVIQIIQAKKRSDNTLSTCIEDAIKLRPQIDRKFVYIGAIINKDLLPILSQKSQLERDRLLEGALTSNIPQTVQWEGRLGKDRFTLVGSEDFEALIKKMTPGFEERINFLLCDSIGVKNG
jgi:DNA-binding transcriptional MerR regulator